MGKQKSYYEINQECIRLKRSNRRCWIIYVIGIICFTLSYQISVARIGEYILEHTQKTVKVYDAQSKPPHGDISPYYFYDSGGGFQVIDVDGSKNEIIASGVCVDMAVSMLGILKRHYTGYDRVFVAVSKNHAQPVIKNIDGTLDYLTLNGSNVIKGKFKSSYDVEVLAKPEDFVEIASYYKPTLSFEELIKYLKVKYKEG